MLGDRFQGCCGCTTVCPCRCTDELYGLASAPAVACAPRRWRQHRTTQVFQSSTWSSTVPYTRAGLPGDGDGKGLRGKAGSGASAERCIGVGRGRSNVGSQMTNSRTTRANPNGEARPRLVFFFGPKRPTIHPMIAGMWLPSPSEEGVHFELQSTNAPLRRLLGSKGLGGPLANEDSGLEEGGWETRTCAARRKPGKQGPSRTEAAGKRYASRELSKAIFVESGFAALHPRLSVVQRKFWDDLIRASFGMAWHSSAWLTRFSQTEHIDNIATPLPGAGRRHDRLSLEA